MNAPVTTTTVPQLGRRDFLKITSGATTTLLGTQFLGLIRPEVRAAEGPVRKNLLIFISDQERPPIWFPRAPENWHQKYQPNMYRLEQNGLSFNKAYCVATMCTPSRTALFTGLFPAQHQSKDTLTEGMQQSLVEHQLDPTLPNMATCLKEAGYDVIYKGKWHLSKEVQGANPQVSLQDDISRYGFDGWDPPDAGENTDPTQFGGGTADNDGRYLNDAVTFLRDRIQNPTDKPFCLIVSLVNPHDVLAYPNVEKFLGGGYAPSWLEPTQPALTLPPTVTENLLANNKPLAQEQYRVSANGLGPLNTPEKQQNYINFYGNLLALVDQQLGQLLSVLDEGQSAGKQSLRDTVIIRTSDHGELLMCHGGMRQKSFVGYEEAVRVPMVWSNPELFPTPRSSDALVSHVDLLPTLCALTGVPNWRAKGFKGVDYSSLLLNPTAPPVQEYVLFTSDDIYAGQNQATFPNGVAHPINRIQMIRTADFKYVRYYGDPSVGEQDEFYDLRPDGGDYDLVEQQPLELKNLSYWAATRPQPPVLTPVQAAARDKLARDLAFAAAARLQPLPPQPPVPPDDIQIQVVSYGTVGPGGSAQVQTQVQVTFISRSNEIYFLQRSLDLIEWEDIQAVACGTQPPFPPPLIPQSVQGNNGPVALCTPPVGNGAYYRLVWAAKPAGRT